MRLPLFFAVLSLAAPVMELQSYPTTEQLLKEQINDNEPQQIAVRSQLTSEEAEESAAFLRTKGIASIKRERKTDQAHLLSQQIWEVAVAPGDAVDALLLLDEEGLPKRKQITIFEEFVTRLRANYKMSEPLQKEAEALEQFIEKQPGVVDAEVLIKANAENSDSRAVVYIQHTGSLDDPHSALANAIKKEAVDKVEGLKEEHLIFITERATCKHPRLKVNQ